MCPALGIYMASLIVGHKQELLEVLILSQISFLSHFDLSIVLTVNPCPRLPWPVLSLCVLSANAFQEATLTLGIFQIR